MFDVRGYAFFLSLPSTCSKSQRPRTHIHARNATHACLLPAAAAAARERVPASDNALPFSHETRCNNGKKPYLHRDFLPLRAVSLPIPSFRIFVRHRGSLSSFSGCTGKEKKRFPSPKFTPSFARPLPSRAKQKQKRPRPTVVESRSISGRGR